MVLNFSKILNLPEICFYTIDLQLVATYVLLYVKLGYSAVISASVMVVMFPVQYFTSERLGKAHERALVGFLKSCRMSVPFISVMPGVWKEFSLELFVSATEH